MGFLLLQAMHMVFLLCVSTCVAVSRASSRGDGSGGVGGYGIILDGGSSGTKLKVYSWREGDRDDSLAVRLIGSEKFKPGISELAHRLGDIDGYMKLMIKRAMKTVPSDFHRKTPLYFMATAGLRVLSTDDTEHLLQEIESVLTNRSVNPFDIRLDNIRVLSGEEEGVYAWIATNYLRGYFWSDKPPSQTVGVLEMGGGSIQMAFLPESSVYANMFPVYIAGRTYNLYAHSYLFYGQNYIVSRINKYLVALGDSKTDIQNPCVLVGDNTTDTSLGYTVHIRGSGDTTTCLEILDIFLATAEDHWCYPKPCAIGRTYQPAVGNSRFYAISSFVYSPTYLNALDELGRLNISLMETNAHSYCQQTLSETVASGQLAKYASSYCTMGLYIPSLLDTYGFPRDTRDITVTNKINGCRIDWAQGAMLLELDRMIARGTTCEESSATSYPPHAFFVITGLLLVALLATR